MAILIVGGCKKTKPNKANLRALAGKLVFMDEYDILYGEMAWFWPIG
jgi:hypothetical protein